MSFVLKCKSHFTTEVVTFEQLIKKVLWKINTPKWLKTAKLNLWKWMYITLSTNLEGTLKRFVHRQWAILFRSRIESYQSTITAHKCLCIHSQNGPVSSHVYVRAERESNSDGSDSHTNCLRYGRVAATDKLPHWFESLANMRRVDKRTCLRLFSILYAECLFANQPAE